MGKDEIKTVEKKERKFRRGVIFRKILIIFILLSLVFIIASVFLMASTYRAVMVDWKGEDIPLEPGLVQLQQKILVEFLLISFFLIALAVLVGVSVARSVTTPVSTLMRGIKEVSRGNLSFRFRIKSKDEFGDLAGFFNEMVIKLEKQRKRERLVAKLKTEFVSIAATKVNKIRKAISSFATIAGIFKENMALTSKTPAND